MIGFPEGEGDGIKYINAEDPGSWRISIYFQYMLNNWKASGIKESSGAESLGNSSPL